MTGFVTGFVFTKQSRPSLETFGATSWLPSLVTIAIIRALAPLVTSLICAGKVGSSIGAELGSMKVTEQIDAMEVSAVNPVRFLVVTRVLHQPLQFRSTLFLLCLDGNGGGFSECNSASEDTSFSAFLEQAFNNIIFLDLWTAHHQSSCLWFYYRNRRLLQRLQCQQWHAGRRKSRQCLSRNVDVFDFYRRGFHRSSNQLV